MHHKYRPIPSQEVDYKISVAACWETPLWENTLLSDLLFMPAPQEASAHQTVMSDLLFPYL